VKSTSEQVILDGKTHEIPTRRVTALFGFQNMAQDPVYPSRIVVDSRMAVEHIEACNKWHKDTHRWLARIIDPDSKMGDITKDFTPKKICRAGNGARTVAGFIDITLKLKDMGVPLVLRHPETGLHPASQAELADFLIKVSE
tara:strand:- start:3773 stop:4198 length:426 start_codon:yes stop_codon:yes gene_type:complete